MTPAPERNDPGHRPPRMTASEPPTLPDGDAAGFREPSERLRAAGILAGLAGLVAVPFVLALMLFADSAALNSFVRSLGVLMFVAALAQAVLGFAVAYTGGGPTRWALVGAIVPGLVTWAWFIGRDHESAALVFVGPSAVALVLLLWPTGSRSSQG